MIATSSFVTEAKLKAINWHDEVNHKYDGSPYRLHLQGVVGIATKYAHLYFKPQEIDTILAACWLHDVIEDCRKTYNDLRTHFGKPVAEIVYNVSSELGKSRSERNSRTYGKIASQDTAIFVKLCDRIANTTYSWYTGSNMFYKYKSEYPEFKKALYNGKFIELWALLEQFVEIWNSLDMATSGAL